MRLRRPLRALPPLLVLAAWGIVTLLARERLAHDRQAWHMRAIGWGVIAAGLIIAWFLLCGPGRFRRRAVIVTVAVGALVAAVRVDGVTGDLVPIMRFRWAPRPELAAVVPAAPMPTAALEGARDYPQFLGPHRDLTLRDLPLARDWDARPPRELWRRAVGAAWSSFAVRGARAITQEQRGEEELVVAYDLATGDPLWAHATAARYSTTVGGTGPRATPTIDGDMVFASGATGILSAVRLADGAGIWSRDTIADGRTRANAWGNSGSPLRVGDLVVINAGGLLALDRNTGEVRWHEPDPDGPAYGSSYASPALLELGGTAQIVMINPQSVSGHDPVSGARLWTFDWAGTNPKVAQPVPVSATDLVVTAGYGVGAVRLHVESDAAGGFEVSPVWRSRAPKAKLTNIVHRDGYLYGLDDGILCCVEAETGARAWKAGRYGHGQIICVDDLLVVMAESGDVALVEITPVERHELTRFTALTGNTWNNPALAGRYLLTRNSEEAACFELPLDESQP